MNDQSGTSSIFELSLSGAFDAAEVDKLRADLDYLTSSHHDCIVLALHNVDFMDSSGIGAIVFLYKRLSTRGRSLRLCGVQGQPLKFLRYLRIDHILDIEPLAAPVGALQES